MSKLLYITIFALIVSVVMPLTLNVKGIVIYTFDVLSLVLFLLVVLDALFSKRINYKLLANERYYLLFLLILIISTFNSINLEVSLNAMALWIRITILYFLFRYSFLVYPKLMTVNFKVSFFILAILITVGSIQYITESNFGLVSSYFGSSNSESVGYAANQRLSGTSGNSNVYGIWLITFYIPVAISLLFKKRNLLLLVTSVLVLLLVTLTQSRTSLIYFVLMLLIMYRVLTKRNFGLRRKAKITKNINTVFYVSLVLLLPLLFTILTLYLYGDIQISVLDRMFKGTQGGADASSSRLESMRQFKEYLVQHPFSIIFTGNGLDVFYETLNSEGIYNYFYQHYVDLDELRAGIHNFEMSFIFSVGFIATFSLIYSYYLTVKLTWKTFKQSNQLDFISIFIALLSIVSVAQFTTVSWSANFLPILALYVAQVNARVILNDYSNPQGLGGKQNEVAI